MNSNYDIIKESKEKNEEDDEINLEKETIKRVKIYIILNGWSHNYIENDSQTYFYLKNLDEEYLDKKFIKSMGKIKNHYYEILRRFGLFYYDRKIIKFIYKYLVIDKKITFEEIYELKNLMREEFKKIIINEVPTLKDFIDDGLIEFLRKKEYFQGHYSELLDYIYEFLTEKPIYLEEYYKDKKKFNIMINTRQKYNQIFNELLIQEQLNKKKIIFSINYVFGLKIILNKMKKKNI
jgi:hypothetical protein